MLSKKETTKEPRDVNKEVRKEPPYKILKKGAIKGYYCRDLNVKGFLKEGDELLIKRTYVKTGAVKY